MGLINYFGGMTAIIWLLLGLVIGTIAGWYYGMTVYLFVGAVLGWFIGMALGEADEPEADGHH